VVSPDQAKAASKGGINGRIPHKEKSFVGDGCSGFGYSCVCFNPGDLGEKLLEQPGISVMMNWEPHAM